MGVTGKNQGMKSIRSLDTLLKSSLPWPPRKGQYSPKWIYAMWIRQPGSPSGVEKEIDSPRARDPPNPCHINTLKHMVITSHGHPICWAGKPKPVKTTRPNCPSHHVSDPLRPAQKKWIPADMARALALFSEICCRWDVARWEPSWDMWPCGLPGNSATRNPGFILGLHPISRLLSLGHPNFFAQSWTHPSPWWGLSIPAASHLVVFTGETPGSFWL